MRVTEQNAALRQERKTRKSIEYYIAEYSNSHRNFVLRTEFNEVTKSIDVIHTTDKNKALRFTGKNARSFLDCFNNIDNREYEAIDTTNINDYYILDRIYVERTICPKNPKNDYDL